MTNYAPMIDSGSPVIHYENPNEELTGTVGLSFITIIDYCFGLPLSLP